MRVANRPVPRTSTLSSLGTGICLVEAVSYHLDTSRPDRITVRNRRRDHLWSMKWYCSTLSWWATTIYNRSLRYSNDDLLTPKLSVLDQLFLPSRKTYLDIRSVEDAWRAVVSSMQNSRCVLSQAKSVMLLWPCSFSCMLYNIYLYLIGAPLIAICGKFKFGSGFVHQWDDVARVEQHDKATSK